MSVSAPTARPLDCRGLSPSERESAVLQTFDALRPGEALVAEFESAAPLVLMRLQKERHGLFEWSPLEEGPKSWRVEIARRNAQPGSTRRVSEALAWDHDRLDSLETRAFESRARGDYAKAAAIYRVFAHGLKRHIRFEERILFPEFESRAGFSETAGPTAVMRHEHREIERLLDEIEQGIGDPSARVDSTRQAMHAVLGDHNVKEENVLYPGADRLMSDVETDELLRRIQES